MFRVTEDPSSGSLVQCLAKNYKNDSIVSVDMDKVGVMAAYSDPLCVCVVHCIRRHIKVFFFTAPYFRNNAINYTTNQQSDKLCTSIERAFCTNTTPCSYTANH